MNSTKLWNHVQRIVIFFGDITAKKIISASNFATYFQKFLFHIRHSQLVLRLVLKRVNYLYVTLNENRVEPVNLHSWRSWNTFRQGMR